MHQGVLEYKFHAEVSETQIGHHVFHIGMTFVAFYQQTEMAYCHNNLS